MVSNLIQIRQHLCRNSPANVSSLLVKNLRQLGLEPIELTAFEPDINLCVITHLNQYLVKTENLRGSTSELLISYVKPHKAVSDTTTGKWCKSMLTDAGTDITEFTSNIGRSAATSYASYTSLTLQEIHKECGWSNTQTFAKHYRKPIVRNFGTSLLEYF